MNTILMQSVIDLAEATKLALEITYERERDRLDAVISQGKELLEK